MNHNISIRLMVSILLAMGSTIGQASSLDFGALLSVRKCKVENEFDCTFAEKKLETIKVEMAADPGHAEWETGNWKETASLKGMREYTWMVKVWKNLNDPTQAKYRLDGAIDYAELPRLLKLVGQNMLLAESLNDIKTLFFRGDASIKDGSIEVPFMYINPKN